MGPAGTRRSGVVVGAWVAYTILVGFFALGFLDPTPSEPGLWGYPYRNMATVVAIATALILPPALLYFLFARLGRRSAMLALVPLATLVLVAYFLVSTRYYVKQTRLFDPFFQVSGHPVPEVQDPGELRVLALGGSTTEGGALKEEERYPVRLSDELGTRLEGLGLLGVLRGTEDPAEGADRTIIRCCAKLARTSPGALARGSPSILGGAWKVPAGGLGTLPRCSSASSARLTRLPT